MTSEILNWLKYIRNQIPFTPGRVLEVGSRDVSGGNPRPYFKDATEYIGIDMEAGEGVDRVAKAEDILDYKYRLYFDTIICCEMLEHDLNFYLSLASMQELLKPKGHLIITTPTFGFPLHRFPKDYWRFGEDAYREVFYAGFDILTLMHLDDALIPAKDVTIAAIGRKR